MFAVTTLICGIDRMSLPTHVTVYGLRDTLSVLKDSFLKYVAGWLCPCWSPLGKLKEEQLFYLS